MSEAGIIEAVAFGLSSIIAIGGALGMATTMSMFRSAIFLMASFMGVAGLFILLSADLLGLLQIMMYIGGMLVMVLFMVLFMHDSGGAMMAGMPEMMTPVERLFSLGLKLNDSGDDGAEQTANHVAKESHADHEDNPGHHHNRHGKHDSGSAEDHHSGHGHAMHAGASHEIAGAGQMNMADMSMVTPMRGWAAWLATATGCVLVALLLLRPSWHLSSALPDPRSALQVGSLLMDKYMIGFEGAGFLILIGIFGAVFISRPGRRLGLPSGQHGREAQVALTGAPPTIEPEPLRPLAEPLDKAAKPSQTPGKHDHKQGGGGF